MKIIIFYVLTAIILCGCGVAGVIKRNDDRYMQPGALDMPLGTAYDTYPYKFLDKYHISHQWPQNAGTCSYRTIDRGNNTSGGTTYEGRDIYEANGHTWQRFENIPPYNFDRYVRSIKLMNPVFEFDKVSGKRIADSFEEVEAGLDTMCFHSWYLTSHSLVFRLHKRDLKTWKALITQYNPNGKWAEQRVGNNVWTVQETPEQELAPRKLNASGGWFQSWILPIGDTDYTFTLQLGASQESLQTPEGHAKMKEIFRHLVESVKIEPIQP